MKTVKDYNLPLNSLKLTITTTAGKNKHCAILPSLCRQCQSEAKHSRIWAQAMPLLPIKQVDLWPSDLESCVRVTCNVGYLCANFSLLKPLCSRVRSDVCDRQTDVRQKHRLMHPPYGGEGIKIIQKLVRRKIPAIFRWLTIVKCSLVSTCQVSLSTGSLRSFCLQSQCFLHSV